MKFTVIAVVVRALGAVPKRLEKRQGELGISRKILSRILLKSSGIFRGDLKRLAVIQNSMKNHQM